MTKLAHHERQHPERFTGAPLSLHQSCILQETMYSHCQNKEKQQKDKNDTVKSKIRASETQKSALSGAVLESLIKVGVLIPT